MGIVLVAQTIAAVQASTVCGRAVPLVHFPFVEHKYPKLMIKHARRGLLANVSLSWGSLA